MNNFWNIHGLWFIFFMFFFPRLTLLLSSVATGGLFWWVGLIFAPRILVAILATRFYLETNFFLVFLTWVWAIGGENIEKNKIFIKIFKRKQENSNFSNKINDKHKDDFIDI